MARGEPPALRGVFMGMTWYVRFGPGQVPPRPSSLPRLRRGWTIITGLKEADAIARARAKLEAGLCAEVGEMIGDKPRVRYSSDKLRERRGVTS